MNKLALKQEIIRVQRENLEAVELEYAEFNENTKLKLQDNLDTDDLSHRTQAEEYSQVFDKQIHNISDNIEKISKISFDKKDKIGLGAVAKVNGQNYIIGIPACQFDFEGENFIAMSSEAPLFIAMMNKSINETFSFNDKSFLVEDIH
ncbi:MAG: hypothetical protein V7719_06010 [Psychroserpens sp.]|uniref:hypothetical protein n=1 Tax=Psychroserpens sp. TaxID=2020870 RepID=UPI003001AC11